MDEKIAKAIEDIDIPEQEFFEDTEKFKEMNEILEQLQADLKENEQGDEGQQKIIDDKFDDLFTRLEVFEDKIEDVVEDVKR